MTIADVAPATSLTAAASQPAPKPVTLQQLTDLLEKEVNVIKPGESHTPEHIEYIKQLLRSVEIDPQELAPYVWWKKDHYTRTRVGYKPDHFALLLLCWNKGQASPCHDHAGSSCWVKVMSGDLREIRYATPTNGEALVETSRVTASNGQVCYINDSMGLHVMGNPRQDEGTISLHIYAPPYKQCTIFEQNGSSRLVSMLASNAPLQPPTGPPREAPLNLAQLVEQLHVKRSSTELIDLADRVVFSQDDCAMYVHFSDRFFTRSLVFRNAIYSVLVFGWNKGQESPTYSLPEGAQFVVRCMHGGPLSIVPADPANPTAVLSVDAPAVLEPTFAHRLTNNPDDIGITLVICNPPTEALDGSGPDGAAVHIPVIHTPGCVRA